MQLNELKVTRKNVRHILLGNKKKVLGNKNLQFHFFCPGSNACRQGVGVYNNVLKR